MDTLAAVLQEILKLQEEHGFWAFASKLSFLKDRDYMRHFELIYKNGFVEPVDTGEFAPSEGGAITITWKGYAFLETHEVWERFKTTFPNSIEERMAYVALVSLS